MYNSSMSTHKVFTIPFIVALTVLRLWFWPANLHAETEKLKARDWPRISEQRKIYYVLGRMETLQKQGHLFDKSVPEYIARLDKRIAQDKSLAEKDMDEIFSYSL